MKDRNRIDRALHGRIPGRPESDVVDDSRPRIIGIALLPSAATLGNLICGFMAILCCLLAIRENYFAFPGARPISEHLREFFPSYVAIGGYLVVAAMIFDALDGRLARIARRTTEFGAQLDSIADIVSFGAAPAMLLITILLTLAVPAAGDPSTSRLQWRIGLSCALVFLSCAAIRLARYNAENTKDETGVRKFSGLPTPGAAAALIAVILLHEDWARDNIGAAGVWANSLRWVMAPIAFGLGMLMISRFENVHVFNVYFNRERPPTHLIWIVVALGLWWYWPQVVQVVVAYAYVLSGLLINARRALHKRVLRSAPAEQPAVVESN